MFVHVITDVQAASIRQLLKVCLKRVGKKINSL